MDETTEATKKIRGRLKALSAKAYSVNGGTTQESQENGEEKGCRAYGARRFWGHRSQH